jgi:SprT protein
MDGKEILAKYLPEKTVKPVYNWIIRYKIHFRISPGRSSKLGDYRPPDSRRPYHRISVNHDLNPYAFFITFVHELAHLLTYKQYGRRVKAHGKEWKSHYRRLLEPFLEKKVFPDGLQQTVYQHLKNIKASSTADVELSRMLMQFDEGNSKTKVEDLQPGDVFLFQGNRKFRVETKLRKRYKCLELDTQRYYIFQPLTPVEMLKEK